MAAYAPAVEVERSLAPTDRRLKRVQIDPSALSLDAAGLDTIVPDLHANGGVFTPTANWLTLDFAAQPPMPLEPDKLEEILVGADRAALAERRFTV
jgi:hypothetical protein